MAIGMRHWIGLTLAGLTLVAIWGLPPETLGPRQSRMAPL